MNKKDYIRDKSKWLQLLDRDSRRWMNCLRFGENERDEHVRAKLDTILKAKKMEKCEFITEVFDRTRKFRADILFFFNLRNICYAQIVEIAKNETEESLERKEKFWLGLGFDFMVIK
jgi:hypothetical protein